MKNALGMLWSIALGIALASGCSESHVTDETDSGPGGAMDSGPRVDAGPGGADAAPPRADTGSPTETDSGPSGLDAAPSGAIDAGPPGVTCGTETCVDPQICCVAVAGGTTSRACALPADCMGVAAACDGPEDCGSGEVCCGMRSAGGGGSGSTACVDEAMCGFGRLCHVTADCAGGDMCCSFMGGSVCSPFCPGGTP